MTLEDLVRLSLEEDVGPGDVTGESCVDASARTRARIEARHPMVLSGLKAAAEVFRQMGDEIPYCTGVDLAMFKQHPDGTIEIDAEIVCETVGQKAALNRSNL